MLKVFDFSLYLSIKSRTLLLMTRLYKIFLLACFWLFSVATYGHDVDNSNQKRISKPNALKQIKELGDECWRLRGTNPDSALILGQKALSLAYQYQITSEISRLSNYVGVLFLNYKYDTQQSIIYFHKCLESSIKAHDSIQTAFAYNNLGDVCLVSGNIPLAIEYAKNSLAIFQSIHYQVGISYGYTNLALAYREKKDYVFAIKYLFKAKKIWEDVGNETGTGLVLLEIARTYDRINELKQSMKYYQLAYSKFHDINRFRFVPECLNGMANVYRKQAQFGRALDYYNRALDINRKHKNNFASIDNLIGKALVLANLNKDQSGIESMDAAIQLSETLGVNIKIMDAYRAAPQFYEILGDYKESIICYSRFVRKYDSLMLVQKAELISEMEDNFKIVQSLHKSEDEVRFQKITKYYFLIISLLMLALFVVFFYRFRSYRKLSKQLKQSNLTKDKLFSVIAHDLKSPFNSSLGFINLLIAELEKGNYEKIKKFAAYVKQSSEESVNLLDHLMSWSRAQTGRIAYNPASFSLNNLFDELAKFLESKAKKDEIQLEFKSFLKKDIIGDQDLLRTILLNLISNAMKFTNNGGLIQVIARNHESNIQIQIIDNGIGIAEEQLKHIFTESSNMQSTLGVRNEQGTGLGLNICFELIHIHQGSIMADSELGKGSVFTIEFPAS
ncbi:tetratricopeptide repeat-containing sensor histidine kinase [Ancylomarina longa]|uniref:histidine kinase n=1 Tax=Ancylomarina longa TaxID=2487017 RepID=A0A434ATN0_9BACT|nr:ATP-binding protein [Ancylomarina longa]RUT77672.1 hypothetical protein DLK05_12150 [Ancylomarina longa]